MVSEKLDGVRAIWNGKKLHFRSGKLISAPDWFIENFPEQLMDGELWMGRVNFEKLSETLRVLMLIYLSCIALFLPLLYFYLRVLLLRRKLISFQSVMLLIGPFA